MNTAFLSFRLRQIWVFIKEIPLLYLIILLIMLGVLFTALFSFMHTCERALIVGGGWIVVLCLIHLRRKDYHFICLVDAQPQRVFRADYLLASLPVMLLGFIQGYWYISLGIIAVVSGVISLLKQPSISTTKGFPVPHIIPCRLFEYRAGFRRYGGWLTVIYILSIVSLWLPYVSFVFLFLYTAFFAECFRTCESKAILCSDELSVGPFLRNKLGLNLRLYLLTIFPVCLLSAILHPSGWWVAILFCLLSSLNVLVCILHKYAFYKPDKKIVSGQVSLTFSFLGILIPVFAPLTLFLLIRCYVLSYKNLTPYLYAYD